METAVVFLKSALEMLRPHRSEAVETENSDAAESRPESRNNSQEKEEVIITSKAPPDIQEENHFPITYEGAHKDEQKKEDISSGNNNVVIQEYALVDEKTEKNYYKSVVLPVHSLHRWGRVEASKAYNIDEDIVPSLYTLHRCLKNKVKTLPMDVSEPAEEPLNKGLTLVLDISTGMPLYQFRYVRKGLTVALPLQMQAQAVRKSQLEKDRDTKINQDDPAIRSHGNAIHSLHKWGMVKATASSVFGRNNNNSMSSPYILQICHGKRKKMVDNIPLVTSMKKGLGILLSLESGSPTY